MNKAAKYAVGIAAALAVAGAGHFAMGSYATKMARKTVADLQKFLPEGATLSHGNVRANAYSSTGGVKDIFYDSAKLSITIGALRVRDFDREGETVMADVIGFENVEIRLKDKGVTYRALRGSAHGSNLGEVLRLIRRATPEELARLIKAREIVLHDVTAIGKGTRLALDEIRGSTIDAGAIATVKLLGLSLGAGSDSTMATCTATSLPVERLAEIASATVLPDQGPALLADIRSVCK